MRDRCRVAVAPVQVRLGSQLSGPLVPASEFPAALQVDTALLADGARRPGPPETSGVPTLSFAALRSGHLFFSLSSAGDGPVGWRIVLPPPRVRGAVGGGRVGLEVQHTVAADDTAELLAATDAAAGREAELLVRAGVDAAAAFNAILNQA
jgi:hypothetical protein